MSRCALRAVALFAVLASGACGDPSGAPHPQPSGPRQQPTPRAVDLAAIAPDQLVDAVLDECHRPLRGRMQRVTARVTFADGDREKVFAELPSLARVQGNDGIFLLRDGAVHRLELADRTATPADAAAAAHVHALLKLIDAAAFGPLHRATGCRRTGPTSFDVDTAEGANWLLTLRPDTLLPASLTRGDDGAQFDDYLHTPTTWVVRAATSAALGRCEVVFEDAGTLWDADLFELPGREADAAGTGHQRIASPGNAVEARNEAPTLSDGKAVRWVVRDDPAAADDEAGWAARAAAYAPVHEELLRQGQRIAGFPILFTEGERRCLAVPFRARKDAAPLDAPADWELRDVPAARWLVVHPPAGDFGVRRALGATLLQKALDQRGLRAAGPITAQPFLHLEDGAPPEDKLRAPTVRMAVRIE